MDESVIDFGAEKIIHGQWHYVQERLDCGEWRPTDVAEMVARATGARPAVRQERNR